MSAALVESHWEGAAWQSYRQAFHDFSDCVRRLQALVGHPNQDRGAVEKALLEVEMARVLYNKKRDALAQQLLPANRRAAPRENSSNGYTDHVRDIAEMLWETAGRPAGTAEDDWRRAEDIMKRALAAAA